MGRNSELISALKKVVRQGQTIRYASANCQFCQSRYPQRLHDLIAHKQAKPRFRRKRARERSRCLLFFSKKGRSNHS